MFDFIVSPAFYVPAIFVFLIIISALIFSKDAKKSTQKNLKNAPYYDEINLSIDYIIRNILPDGRFVYTNNVDTNIKHNNITYNSLRHAGVLYSLYLYERIEGDSQYFNLRLNSSKYFMNKYINKIDNTNKYIVISNPKEEGTNIPIAKSGAAGLALCALSNLYPQKEIDLEILQGLGNFLLDMLDENGNVYAYYDLKNKVINKDAQAIYYPGEAAAGLISLYEIDKQEKWITAAIKILLYLSKNLVTETSEPIFDHWAAFTIEKIFKTKLISQEEHDILQDYAEKMALPMLKAQITNKNHRYYGAWMNNIIPASIGTIMEGLGSIYFCTEDTKLKMVIFKSLSAGCKFLSKAQVKTGLNAGGIPNSADWTNPTASAKAGIIRIDNVQHAICAWLKFQKINLK